MHLPKSPDDYVHHLKIFMPEVLDVSRNNFNLVLTVQSNQSVHLIIVLYNLSTELQIISISFATFLYLYLP